jgi:chaperone required for assembly of F1-ATPase
VKRFYKSAGVSRTDDGFAVELDGRPVKTPAKNVLVLPGRPLADAIAAEWEEQGEDIDAHAMRLTRLANSTIDRVVEHRAAVISEIAGYANTDLVCYRAAEPEALAQQQKSGWDPLVAWLQDHYGIALLTTTSLLPIEQKRSSIDAVESAVAESDPFTLAGLHLVTVSCGSVVIGLAALAGRIDGTAAWELSLIDETYQIDEWGEDPEATKRRKGLLEDINAATAFLRLHEAAD